ncbi:TlyA family RNA methyltransferase [Paenactinomyces guangxiensis]|uniref:TlyA family RNA methyltransferase n=1 Tax=Paenactinomyces guangxiensis TaxID=1490290 RepID=A0A7W2A9A1_9BACL|nr:TlyA family RNA methyltransferase [Paenactinomyces guangxiensis]MBA4495004.1 TlyA family RNA methyltransferase [Paenactinomyces guangxiensis]MBH8592087.1 TlyA family RNA methyltransferase [Paenactinomyces guangxiensis]
MNKERLDLLLVQKGYFNSRQQAQRSIMAGLVFINQERIDKAGTKVPSDAVVEIKGQLHPYVSRGGLKLEEALRFFSIQMDGRVMIDIGASTGGFTDCALQNGVRKVYAVDVGYGQLAWKLRQDPRVIVMERTNFRYLKREQLGGESPDLATIDVSFISLSHILPNLKQLLLPDGEVVALVKPQFEAGREQVGKKGIVKDPAVHCQVLSSFVQFAHSQGFEVKGLAPSPIQGGEGNIEFLSYFIHREPGNKADWTERIEAVVRDAHMRFG